MQLAVHSALPKHFIGRWGEMKRCKRNKERLSLERTLKEINAVESGGKVKRQ